MSAIEKLKEYIPGGGDDVETRTLECQECGEAFETAKVPQRADCPECLSHDVREA